MKHMFHRRFLIVGHPRTGTGFAASLLRQFGFDVGHERDGKDGISSWMFAVQSDENPYALSPIARTRKTLRWDYLLHPVRDIVSAVPSVMRDNLHASPSYIFRRDHIKRLTGIELDTCPTNFERAVRSLLEWTKIIESMNPDCRFRIEDEHHVVRAFLQDVVGIDLPQTDGLDLSPVNADKPYRGQRYPKPETTPTDWASLGAATWRDIRNYCETYGYVLPERG